MAENHGRQVAIELALQEFRRVCPHAIGEPRPVTRHVGDTETLRGSWVVVIAHAHQEPERRGFPFTFTCTVPDDGRPLTSQCVREMPITRRDLPTTN